MPSLRERAARALADPTGAARALRRRLTRAAAVALEPMPAGAPGRAQALPRPLHRFAHVEPPPPGRLLIDARIVEMENAERGISRYVQGLGKALLAQRPGAVRFLFDRAAPPSPFRLGLPPEAVVLDLDRFLGREPLAFFLQGCHFLLHRDFDELYPPALLAAGCRVGAIFYDAIPWRMPRDYLADRAVYAAYHDHLFALRDADRLFAISRHAAEEARTLLERDEREVVFLGGGVDPDRWPAASPARPAAVPPGPFWLCVGGADPRKNIPRLIDGFARFRSAAASPARLVVACSLPEEVRHRLEARIRDAGLTPGEDVVLTGYVDDAALARLYSECVAVVLPSLLEGLGLPILEGYHFGKPALGSGVSAVAELVHPACRFDPLAPEDIAAALLRLDGSPALAAESAAFGRAILADYSWTRAAERLLGALAESGVAIRGDDPIPTVVQKEGPGLAAPAAPAPEPASEPAETTAHATADAEPEAEGPFVSSAQNFEDVVLWRALREQTPGRYIDIGAQDPVRDSVSLGFYRKGWRGVHVEPVPGYAAALRRARPDEIVLEAAVAAEAGTLPFHEVVDTGLGTGIARLAEAHAAAGRTVVPRQVRAIVLDHVFAVAGEGPIHWLKIDVEGMEAEVLRGWRSEVRPWVVVVEDMDPLQPMRRLGACDPMLEAKGYRRCLFDGLNSFWLHDSRSELADRLAFGAGLWDDAVLDEPSFVPLARRLMRRLHAARAESLAHRREALREREHALGWRQRYDALRAACAALRAERDAQALRAAQLEAQLAAVLGSTSWRATAPLRRLAGLLRRSSS